MSDGYFDPGFGPLVMIGGNMVERDALNIAERINEYDSRLSVMCLDPAKAGINEAPFLILEELDDGRRVRVMEAWKLDEEVLERIYNSDTKRVDVLLSLDRMKAQQQKDQLGRYQEKRDSQKELFLDIIKSPKSSYSVKNEEGDVVTHFENRPPEKNNAKKSF